MNLSQADATRLKAILCVCLVHPCKVHIIRTNDSLLQFLASAKQQFLFQLRISGTFPLNRTELLHDFLFPMNLPSRINKIAHRDRHSFNHICRRQSAKRHMKIADKTSTLHERRCIKIFVFRFQTVTDKQWTSMYEWC